MRAWEGRAWEGTVKVWEGKGERGKLGNFIGTEEARTLKTTTRDMEPISFANKLI